MAKETRNLLVNIIFEKQFKNIINQYADGCLIDIGCGEKPYKDLVAPFITEHIGIDYIDTMHDTKNIDIFATAYEIPVPNDSFDTAICTSVLEHLEV